ncbi:DMT family transporter [Citrobacter freundii]|uniref:DMT family transporter n=1 Tax=Citrobacter freundii TaxID=546 RepID=UPI0028C030BD|nr:SMR family transporter [Citrobacter freundii]MDT7368822.1 SMR family transporter [Citrobacter freundii]
MPMGTAYAVWTGIGSLGAFLVGVYVFGDTASLIRWAGIALVVSGIVCLKMG